MKSIKFLIGTLALASLTACNSLSQREDGLPDLPKFLMHKALGNSYYVDTLYVKKGNAYCVLQNPEYGQRILFDNNKIYASSPLMDIDSVSPDCYSISMLWRSVDVDFSKPESLQLIDTVVPSNDAFKREVKGYSVSEPLYAHYGLTMDMPKGEVPQQKQVDRWLASQLGCTETAESKVDFDKIGEDCSLKFFESISKEGDEAPEQSVDLYSADFCTAYYYNKSDYVTYLYYNDAYVGGAHGMYNIRLITYSFSKGEGITLENAFKPGSEANLRELIFEAIAKDTRYAQSHGVSTVDEVKRELEAMNIKELPLPQPALLPEGIVFCYQPYEIGPYSDGAYQFIVPWEAASDILN